MADVKSDKEDLPKDNINTASSIKGDSKPDPVVKEEDLDVNEKQKGDNTSSIGEKNVVERKGGGDGSLPGDAPNTFIDKREVPGYVDPDEGKL